MRMLPPVSVPSVPAARPAAMAAPEPPLEPPGMRSRYPRVSAIGESSRDLIVAAAAAMVSVATSVACMASLLAAAVRGDFDGTAAAAPVNRLGHGLDGQPVEPLGQCDRRPPIRG